MKNIASLAALTLVAACASTPHGSVGEDGMIIAPEGMCDADAAQTHLGQRATAQIGATMLSETGARQLRWVPPRTAVTMDYRADRLTVTYDDDLVIERITCG